MILLKIINQNGADFIVISAEDWEKDQETLAILQNNSLFEQISQSIVTHAQHKGYSPKQEELNEILSV